MNSPSRLSRLLFQNFRRYQRYSRWYFRSFTPVGQFVQVGLLTCAVVGINTEQALAYQIFGVLLGLFAVSLAYRRFLIRPPASLLQIQRLFPRYATVGETVRYRLRISHRAKHALVGLSLLENHHDPRPSFPEFSQAREPGAERRNRYDRFMGYYRWSWLVRRNEVARIEEIHLPELPPGKTVEVAHSFIPRFRGQLSLSGLSVAQCDPIGLCRAIRELALPGSLLVLPRTYSIPPLNLPGQLHHQPEHRVSAATVGEGEEIAGLREYRSGDSLRDIHWKSFARTGTPMVKEYQAECFERHALLLDTVGAAEGAAFEEAISLAASFVGNFGGNECLLDLLFVGTQCHCFTAGPGELQTEALLRVLALVNPCPQSDLASLKATILSRRRELSSCIFILLAWDPERREMLAEMLATGLPLLVLLVSEQIPTDAPSWLLLLAPGRVEEGLRQL